jgi:hypothetical protein|tara:strand:+ start:20019 stop:21044 length:1026 start_codon:yes stop_codon:yes gene_type:complete
MQPTPNRLNVWHSPSPDDLGDDHIEFLHRLQAPTWITVTGKDNSRTRAIVTLLHGNEPSGLSAVHSILKQQIVPATNLIIVVASVNTALYPPILSHRFLPWEEDFNRCFNAPADTSQRQLAAEIFSRLHEAAPEVIVDTHNTSGHSEPFAVAVNDSIPTQQISQLFTNRLVVIDQHLGALIEKADNVSPVVTIEFGGLMDPRADRLAHESLMSFVTRNHLFSTEPEPLHIIKHPLRLEIEESSEIHYSSSVQDDADLTLLNTIDQLNFQPVYAGTKIGWLGRSGLQGLRAINAKGDNLFHSFFHEVSGFLTTKQQLTIFMATTDPYIARKDCLLYFTPTIL